MRIMRYLLITFAVMMISLMAVSAKAQTVAQPPQPEFRSTSSMVWSGSTLPQAAQTGAYTTYDTDASGKRYGKAGINRAGGSTGGSTEGGPDDREDPYGDPIGEGMWILVALAACYAAFAAWRKRNVKLLKR